MGEGDDILSMICLMAPLDALVSSLSADLLSNIHVSGQVRSAGGFDTASPEMTDSLQPSLSVTCLKDLFVKPDEVE